MTNASNRRTSLGVVVPVHNEQDLLGDCLAALRDSARAVADRARVSVVVVLDSCSDRSELIARAHGVGILRLGACNVGRARHAGAAALLARGGPEVAWLASTDADSQVPVGWLGAHLDTLEAGWDALAGTVRVIDWGEHPTRTQVWFRDVYEGRGSIEDVPIDIGHGHVHGANLGVRGGSYRAVGGFAPVPTGEDVALVAHLHRAGHHVRRTRATPVLTSARTVGRSPAGFAAHLTRLSWPAHRGPIPVHVPAP